MSLEVAPESQSHKPPLTPEQASKSAMPSPAARWWVRGVLSIGIIAVLGAAAFVGRSLFATADTGPRLTQPVTRGDVIVTVTEEGTLESAENTEIKCRVRGQNVVISVVESGTYVQSGDELVRLDTLFIEEQIDERTKYAHWSRSGAERSAADVIRSELAVSEYRDGRFVEQLAELEKALALAESNLRTQRNQLRHVQSLFERGYRSELQVDETKFSVRQAELNVEVAKTRIDVLKNFSKEEQLETLRGNLKATQAIHKANVERAEADASRRDRAVEELGYCTITAPRAGLVIYPSAAAWKTAPDIEEGATVHKDQVLLLMPDMSRMQVKIGIHESLVDRLEEGQPARVAIGEQRIDAKVKSVASVTQAAGWWTGNVVKYDTIIELPSVPGLKPGMSAEVDVILAEYHDVLRVPIAAVVDTEAGAFCWVKTSSGPERRELILGDSNDVYVVVESGVAEGDEVILDPTRIVQDAQQEVLKQRERKEDDEESQESKKPDAALPGKEVWPPKPESAESTTGS